MLKTSTFVVTDKFFSLANFKEDQLASLKIFFFFISHTGTA